MAKDQMSLLVKKESFDTMIPQRATVLLLSTTEDKQDENAKDRRGASAKKDGTERTEDLMDPPENG